MWFLFIRSSSFGLMYLSLFYFIAYVNAGMKLMFGPPPTPLTEKVLSIKMYGKYISKYEHIFNLFTDKYVANMVACFMLATLAKSQTLISM